MVKEPWCRSSHWEVLKQMLTTNSHNDKLAAVCVDFASCGMLEGTVLEDILHQLSESHPALHLVSNSDDNELEDNGDRIDDSHIIESRVMLSKTPCKCSPYLHASALY